MESAKRATRARSSTNDDDISVTPKNLKKPKTNNTFETEIHLVIKKVQAEYLHDLTIYYLRQKYNLEILLDKINDTDENNDINSYNCIFRGNNENIIFCMRELLCLFQDLKNNKNILVKNPNEHTPTATTNMLYKNNSPAERVVSLDVQITLDDNDDDCEIKIENFDTPNEYNEDNIVSKTDSSITMQETATIGNTIPLEMLTSFCEELDCIRKLTGAEITNPLSSMIESMLVRISGTDSQMECAEYLLQLSYVFVELSSYFDYIPKYSLTDLMKSSTQNEKIELVLEYIMQVSYRKKVSTKKLSAINLVENLLIYIEKSESLQLKSLLVLKHVVNSYSVLEDVVERGAVPLLVKVSTSKNTNIVLQSLSVLNFISNFDTNYRHIVISNDIVMPLLYLNTSNLSYREIIFSFITNLTKEPIHCDELEKMSPLMLKLLDKKNLRNLMKIIHILMDVLKYFNADLKSSILKKMIGLLNIKENQQRYNLIQSIFKCVRMLLSSNTDDGTRGVAFVELLPILRTLLVDATKQLRADTMSTLKCLINSVPPENVSLTPELGFMLFEMFQNPRLDVDRSRFITFFVKFTEIASTADINQLIKGNIVPRVLHFFVNIDNPALRINENILKILINILNKADVLELDLVRIEIANYHGFEKIRKLNVSVEIVRLLGILDMIYKKRFGIH